MTLPWDCPTCETGGYPSLWASADERKRWEAALCDWHAKKLAEERAAWDAVTIREPLLFARLRDRHHLDRNNKRRRSR